jgi:hypothetical protein
VLHPSDAFYMQEWLNGSGNVQLREGKAFCLVKLVETVNSPIPLQELRAVHHLRESLNKCTEV